MLTPREREAKEARLCEAKDDATKHFFQPTASAEAIGETIGVSEKVVGWGIGINASGEDTLLVHVQEKFPDTDTKIPGRFGDLPTEIVEVGQATAYQNPRARHRPTLAGVSVGHPSITSGTLGCLVEKGGDHYILSNNHVLAATNTAEEGAPVVQPGPKYGGSSVQDSIAILEPYQPIDFSLDQCNPNRIDAAIAKVGDCQQTVVVPEIIGIGMPKSTPLSCYVPDPRGRYVRKYGSKTKETIGVVQAIDFLVIMRYKVGDQEYKALFDGQIVIEGVDSEPFSKGGDSGALIVDSETLKPVGLLFGGGNDKGKKVTYANPIDLVLKHYDVTIVGE